MLKERLAEVKTFFIAYTIITIIVLIYYWFYLTTDFKNLIDFIFKLIRFPYPRADLISFGSGAIIMFIIGYRQKGIHFGLLYTMAILLLAPVIWDNFWMQVVVYRAKIGEISFDLNAPMEIQFIYLLMTINQYRYFTIIYALVGLISLIIVRKPLQFVMLGLFVTYVYSSLVIGFLLNLGMNSKTITTGDSVIYICVNILIGIIFLIIAIIVKGLE